MDITALHQRLRDSRGTSDPSVLSKTVQATNVHAILLSLCALVVGTILVVMKIHLMGGLAIATAVLFMLAFSLNKLGFYNIARVFLIFVLNSAIYLFSVSLGHESETHLWYISSAILSFGIFSLNETGYLLGGIALSIGSLFFLSITNFQYAPLPILTLDPTDMEIISTTMRLLSSSIAVSVAYFVALGHQSRAAMLSTELAKAVRENKEKFRTIVENISDHSLTMLDPIGVILSWSPGAKLIKGYEPSEAIGQHFSKFFTPEGVASGLPESILVAAEEKGHYAGEGWRVRKSGERFWAAFSISAIFDENGKVTGFTKVVRDCTNQKREADQFALTQAIDRSLTRATNEVEIIEFLLSDVTQHLKWKVAIFWKPNSTGSHLEYSGCFSSDNSNAKTFGEESKRFSFTRGQGLPGRAWESRGIAWLENAPNDQNFPRFALARATGMMTGVVVPIQSGDFFLGCFEFFTDDNIAADLRLMDVFQESQWRIGQRLQFFRAKEESDQKHLLLQSLIDGYPGPIQVQSLDGRSQLVNEAFLKVLGVTREKLIGSTIREVLPNAATSEAEREFQAVISSIKSITVEKTAEVDGQTKTYLVNKFPLFNRENAISSICTIGTDITEKRTAELRLHESERRLKFALEGTNDGVWDWDLANGQMHLSAAFANKFGYPQQIPLVSVNDMKSPIHPDDWEATRESIETHLAGRSLLHEAEARLRTTNGTWHWVLTRGKVSERSSDGTPIRMTGVHVQIDHIKKFEEDLRLAHGQVLEQKQIADALLIALDHSAIVAVTDLRGRIKTINNLFCELSGYSREELLGKDHRILNSKLLPKSFFKNMWRTIQSGQVWKGEIVNRKKNGELYWLSSTIVPKREVNGNILEYIAIRFDITKQKEIENQLINIADSIPAVVSHWDRGLRNKFSNQAGHDWFAISPEELQRTQLPQLLGEESYRNWKPIVEMVFAGVPQRIEGELRRPRDSSMRKVVVTYLPDTVGSEVRGVFICVQDVTELKLAEESARDGQKKAMVAGEAKSNFLANMSHEIRTPLNAILGMTDLLLETALDQEQMRLAHTVHSSGNHLLRLINDILDHSKIEAGKLELEIIDFDLVDLIESHADLLLERAREKNLSLLTYVDPTLPVSLKGDPSRIGQILLNFISNAIKFTTRGAIVVRAEGSPMPKAGDSATRIRVSVQDSGIGILDNVRDRLFQPFTQTDNSTSRKFGGTGLGLLISKNLVEMMQGVIGVDSIAGQGSTFWFECELPVAITPGGQSGKLLQIVVDGGKTPRILVVDEDPLFGEIMEKYLLNWGMQLRVVESAAAGLSLLEAPSESFDLIIIDLKMAAMDGPAFGRRIKANPVRRHLPMILVTALDRQSHTSEASSVGFLTCIQKPLKQSELYSSIASALMGSRGVVGSDAAPLIVRVPASEHVVKQSGRILVAEDVVANQILVSRYLEKLGYSFQLVSDGQAVLETLGGGRFNLILMDCQMPILDGFEATRRIRKKEAETGDHVVIIALTANAMKEDEIACREAGMDDYLAKPLKREKLAAKLEVWLNSKLKKAS